MSASSSKLVELRRLLAERFPDAGRTTGRALATGIEEFDRLSGGLPLGAITEVVCAAPSCGGHLFWMQVLAATRAARSRVVLVDAADTFDPASYPADLLTHLVWVRCRSAGEALQATDLLARDANFSVVALDLRGTSETALRGIPATTWYRLQRAVEPANLSLLVESLRPIVPSAQLRIELTASHSLSGLDRPRTELAAHLSLALHRHRMSAIANTG